MAAWKKMWFGTAWHGEWIDCTLRGTDMSPHSWGATGTLLDGGGYVLNSQGSHKEYVLEWKESSSQAAALKMQAYRNGLFSRDIKRDLFYLIDPFTAEGNMAPPHWANPALLWNDPPAGYVDTALGRILGVVSPISPPSDNPYYLALNASRRVHIIAPSSTPSSIYERGLVFPIIDGGKDPVTVTYTVVKVSPGSGVFYRTLFNNGTMGPEEEIPQYGFTLDSSFASTGKESGILIYLKGELHFQGVTIFRSSVLTEKATPMLLGEDINVVQYLVGMGNSGLKFVGNPTFIGNNSSFGHVGYSVTLKEVGDWR